MSDFFNRCSCHVYIPQDINKQVTSLTDIESGSRNYLIQGILKDKFAIVCINLLVM